MPQLSKSIAAKARSFCSWCSEVIDRIVPLHGAIVPTLLAMAWPNVLVMTAQASTGLIETWWVSRLGTDALAGQVENDSSTLQRTTSLVGTAV